MDSKQLTLDVLNAIGDRNIRGVREAVRKITPQIRNLESLDTLIDLRLTSLTTDSDVKLCYEATATVDLYPYVRSRLISAGIIKKDNVVSTTRNNKGENDEYELLHFSFRGAHVQAILKVYNPNCDPSTYYIK